MNDSPLVSVCMLAYNHEYFIAEAIEGILTQQIEFPIEVVIGEDFSTDNTLRVASAYAQANPGTIRVLKRGTKLGMIPNFVDTFNSCLGKYVALCEGDDYWTDPLKLQKQVDFLEANPDFAICFHAVRVVCEGVDSEGYLSNHDQATTTSFEDLAQDNYIHTASCVFRNHLFDAFPAWFSTCAAGDYVLHLLNAQYGKIMFIDEPMAVYRMHAGGAWSLVSREVKHRQWLEIVRFCREYFAPRGIKGFESQISYGMTHLCLYQFQNGRFSEFRRGFIKLLKTRRINSVRIFAALSLRYVLSYHKVLATSYQRRVSLDTGRPFLSSLFRRHRVPAADK